MIALIDYGMGNIHSVQKALQLLGAQVCVTNKPQEIKRAEKSVLPGVGAFDDAMLELKAQGLISVINEHIKADKPFLGICLGMQLLFEESEEARKEKGLGILKGKVRRFKEAEDQKVPHMGWNQLNKLKTDCPLLNGIVDDANVYFCHSYYPQPEDESIIAATTGYGVNFASLVWKGKLFGAQFHPEKSQAVGLKILENFVKLC
jgi:imidazole glycerol-phosphate synthase subunit HisH